MKITSLILLAVVSLNLAAQNIFPVKLENCNTEKFCMDCGDLKAGYDEEGFLKIQNKINTWFNLRGIKGVIKFQVLVDAKGRACVLSHTDRSNSSVTLKIIEELNKLKKWTPAITNNKVEEKSSITLVFTIGDNRVAGTVERVDAKAFLKSFDRPRNPEIYNTIYKYKNENLNNYKITVWNSTNSSLPDNMTDYIALDKKGLVWLTVDQGLVKFDGENFKNEEQNITDKGNYFAYRALAIDNNNIKWIYAKENIYSFDDIKWKKYDSTDIGITGAFEIINNSRTGEVFFCSNKGLTIYKDGKWSTITKNEVKEFPSNRVGFAKRDSKNRIWIGTYNGSVMIDENGKATNFENSETVLKSKCITSMDEDENGNLYFSLYELERADKKKINNDEGIAVRYTDGTYKQFTTDNSGMPFNHSSCVLYDKREKVLWISTDRAGLVRFDLKEGWENYHNENSDIPTSYISTMIFDKDGNLNLATRQGLVKIERK